VARAPALIVRQGDRRGVVLALGGAVAALQVGLAAAWPGAVEHLGAVALGWFGALLVLALAPAPARSRPRAGHTAAGLALLAGAAAVGVAARAAYGPWDRLLPLAAGAGLLLLRAAPDRATAGRALAAWCAPLLSPLPAALTSRFAPTEATTALAALALRTAGLDPVREGTLLHLGGETLQVFPGCSGLGAVGQMLALALVAVVLLRPAAWRAAALVASAAAIGFGVNAVRIAWLAVAASRGPTVFAYYEGYGRGAALFPLLAMTLALGAWWALLAGAPHPSSADATPPA
jgi:exosortase/archaeosortase family protein